MGSRTYIVVTNAGNFSGVLIRCSPTRCKTHEEIMEDCTCTTARWKGTEQVWSFLDKKAKQLNHSGKGDVLYKNNAKLNKNHELLT